MKNGRGRRVAYTVKLKRAVTSEDEIIDWCNALGQKGAPRASGTLQSLHTIYVTAATADAPPRHWEQE